MYETEQNTNIDFYINEYFDENLIFVFIRFYFGYEPIKIKSFEKYELDKKE